MDGLFKSVLIAQLLCCFLRDCYGVRCMVCEQDVELNDHPYCGHAWIPEANRYITNCEESPPGLPNWNRCFKTIYEELGNGDTYYVRECGLGSAMQLELGCKRWIERGYGFDVELCVCEGDLCNRDITYREFSLSNNRFSKSDSWFLMGLATALIILLSY